MEWLQKGIHEKHLSVYDFEKKMRKAEVAELEQEISGQKDKIASQGFLMECHREVELAIERIKKKDDVTEQLKKEYPMEWLQRVNGIKTRLEERIVNNL